MLNILKIKSNNNNNKVSDIVLTKSNQIQHFSPATKEWNNSIYAYNKNILTLIPISSKITTKLFKSYFNLYNNKWESKMKYQPTRIKLRKLSSHKIYVSKSEFKHTNEKIYINIYVYNRQKYNYLYKINKILKNLKRFFLSKDIKINKEKGLFLVEEIINNNIALVKNEKWKDKFKYYNNIFYKKYIKKSIKRQMLYIYYKRLLLINKIKFKYTYLNKIINLLKKIYSKNIELNIINLKYFYLNSDIFTESIINKITKNRKWYNRILKRSVEKVKIVDKNWMRESEDISIINRLAIRNFIETNEIKINLPLTSHTNLVRNHLDNLLNKIFYNYIITDKNKKETIINYIKNKTITGVRLEAAGRLSKRHTASRSITKLRHNGSLKNKDSSFKQISSVVLRGNSKVNIQYTKLNSIARIGSFGLKGWISNN